MKRLNTGQGVSDEFEFELTAHEDKASFRLRNQYREWVTNMKVCILYLSFNYVNNRDASFPKIPKVLLRLFRKFDNLKIPIIPKI